MLSSISPLGERARGSRWWRTTAAYFLGSVLGGATLGALLGGVGRLVPAPRALVAVVAAFAVLGVLADVTGRLPTVHRQVDETWLHRYRDWVYGGGFGLQLGMGVLTIVTSASTYLTWCLELVTRQVIAGLVVGGVFGLARALPLLLVARVHDAAALRHRHRRVAAAAPRARRLAVVGQLTAAAMLAVVAGAAR